MKNVHNHSIITSKSDADEIIEEMENSRDRCIPLSEKFKEEIKIWRRGDFPENFLLKHEIIDLEHPNTKAFTELCAELIAPLYTDKNVPAFIGEDLVQYDFSKNPVRFLLSKNPLVNAFAIPIANPPVIIINEGMFTQGWISTREELQAVLIHEMTHILLAKRHGLGRKVWKREESIAYSLPFYLLSRTESNITNIYEEGSMYHRMSTTHISNEEHWSVMCSDEHVTPDTMKKIVTSSLAATVSLRDAQKKKTREVDDIWLGQVKVFYEENEQNRIRDMLKNGSGTVCEKLERVIIDIAESLREADVANILDIFEKTLQEEPDSKKNIYALFQKYAWKLYNLGVRPINPGTGRRLDKGPTNVSLFHRMIRQKNTEKGDGFWIEELSELLEDFFETGDEHLEKKITEIARIIEKNHIQDSPALGQILRSTFSGILPPLIFDSQSELKGKRIDIQNWRKSHWTLIQSLSDEALQMLCDIFGYFDQEIVNLCQKRCPEKTLKKMWDEHMKSFYRLGGTYLWEEIREQSIRERNPTTIEDIEKLMVPGWDISEEGKSKIAGAIVSYLIGKDSTEKILTSRNEYLSFIKKYKRICTLLETMSPDTKKYILLHLFGIGVLKENEIVAILQLSQKYNHLSEIIDKLTVGDSIIDGLIDSDSIKIEEIFYIVQTIEVIFGGDQKGQSEPNSSEYKKLSELYLMTRESTTQESLLNSLVNFSLIHLPCVGKSVNKCFNELSEKVIDGQMPLFLSHDGEEQGTLDTIQVSPNIACTDISQELGDYLKKAPDTQILGYINVCLGHLYGQKSIVEYLDNPACKKRFEAIITRPENLKMCIGFFGRHLIHEVALRYTLREILTKVLIKLYKKGKNIEEFLEDVCIHLGTEDVLMITRGITEELACQEPETNTLYSPYLKAIKKISQTDSMRKEVLTEVGLSIFTDGGIEMKEFFEFLISRGTDEDYEHFGEILRVNERLDKGSDQDDEYKHELYYSNLARLIYRNVWTLPHFQRIIFFREILEKMDTSGGLEGVSLLKYVTEKILSSDMPYAGEAKEYISNYIECIPVYTHEFALGALVSAGQKKEGANKEIGAILAEFIRHMGPVEIRMGQVGHSHPLVDVDIRKHLASLKYSATPTDRYEVVKRVMQEKPKIEEYLGTEIESIDHVIGVGSMYIAVRILLKDGRTTVLSYLKDNAYREAKNGVHFHKSTLQKLLKNSQWSHRGIQVTDELLTHADNTLEIDADCKKALAQYEAGSLLYHGELSDKTGKSWGFVSPKVLYQGDSCYLMEEIPGTHFTELPEKTPLEKKSKNEVALYVVTKELSNIFNGLFCDDRHGGNIKIDSANRTIGHFDFKSWDIRHTWDREGAEQFIDMLMHIFEGKNWEGGNADVLATFLDYEHELREKGQHIHPMVTHTRMALLKLTEYLGYLGIETIKDALTSALGMGVHDQLALALAQKLKVPSLFQSVFCRMAQNGFETKLICEKIAFLGPIESRNILKTK